VLALPCWVRGIASTNTPGTPASTSRAFVLVPPPAPGVSSVLGSSWSNGFTFFARPLVIRQPGRRPIPAAAPRLFALVESAVSPEAAPASSVSILFRTGRRLISGPSRGVAYPGQLPAVSGVCTFFGTLYPPSNSLVPTTQPPTRTRPWFLFLALLEPPFQWRWSRRRPQFPDAAMGHAAGRWRPGPWGLNRAVVRQGKRKKKVPLMFVFPADIRRPASVGRRG